MCRKMFCLVYGLFCVGCWTSCYVLEEGNMTNLSSRDPKRLHLDGCTVAMTVSGFEMWKTATRAMFDGI
ncbi:hypothetical protein KQX54_019932 [Cotesia glomerata]|uniref:Secreted protein n=1 Tax=Cotesia glomerata TaxID=32391 RepID=A0AAV7I4I8_COTGL|nr:hypothetical protein KQX54_019932 [Cotesia glomerata]